MKLSCPRNSTAKHPARAHVKPLPSSSSPTSTTSSLPRTSTGMTQHAYTLRSASSHYVSLSLDSVASSADKTPVINASLPVTGEVTLELSSLPAIKDVLITISGRMHGAGAQPSSFLSHTLSLFAPALPQPAPETSTIDGTHTLPFQLWLPAIGANGLPLPPSWSSALSPATKIEYTVSLAIRPKNRGTHFCPTPDDVLDVPVTFIPRVRASEKAPPVAWSALEGTAGEWPRERDAWHLSTSNIRGTQFSARDAPLRTTLGLAAPLTYPIHSTIPFTLTLADDTHTAPDVLAAPIAIAVDLRRAVRYVPTTASIAQASACGLSGPNQHPPLWCKLCRSHRCKCKGSKKAAQEEAARGVVQEWTWETVATARCWQVPHASRYVRVVRGELDLNDVHALEPSFTFGGLAVSYAVHVRFSAPVGGKTGQGEEHFTFVEPVTLVSDPAGYEPRLSIYASGSSTSGSLSKHSTSTSTSVSTAPTTLFSDDDAPPPSYEQTQRLSFSQPPTPPYSTSSLSSSRTGSVRVASRSATMGGKEGGRRSRKAHSAERPAEGEAWMARMRGDEVLLA